MRGSTELSNLSAIGSAISKTQRSLFPKGAKQNPKKKAKQELKKSSGKPASPTKPKIIKPDHPAKKKPEVINKSSSKQFLGMSDTSHLPAVPLD